MKRLLTGFWQSFCLAAFFLLMALVLVVPLIGQPLVARVSQVLGAFDQTAGRGVGSIGAELMGGWWYGEEVPFPTSHWLILGTDEVAGSHRPNVLTDTIMLVTYRPDENTVRLLSFPRDIYLPTYGTKINQLYQLGREQNPQQPLTVVTEALQTMIGQPLRGVIVLSLADVGDLIDRLGGVWIEVPHTFTDEQFPRSGVDVTTEHDPAVLYETIHFEAGGQLMSGEMALKYLRSRHANEFEEQGDQARMRRQKQVLAAVLQRMETVEVIGDPRRLGSLYDWYAHTIMPTVSLFELGWLGQSVAQQSFPTVQPVSLPVTEYPFATDEATLFVHPPDDKYQQWAYESVDPTWQRLHHFIEENQL